MKTIGRYKVRGLLGRGGMSNVFKVSLPVIGKICALKLLSPDPLLVQLMGWDQILTQFEKEAVTMAAVRHANVVEIHDFDSHEDRPFYVMDFYANNLGALIGETGRVEHPSRIIPTDKALRYIRQAIIGMGCLHYEGIVHRDIKPFNLLITDDDTIKIGDFGLSKLRGDQYSGPSQLNVGSPYYAAPEQENDPNRVDGRADLFAAGVILYRMITGCLPDVPAGRIEPASHLNPDLDRHWDVFLTKAMMVDPQKRFPDAGTMLDALDGLCRHWEKRKAQVCELPPMNHDAAPERLRRHLQRSHPVKLPSGPAAGNFDVDMLWRPKAYMSNALEVGENSLVTDHATSLVWQQSGSEYTRTWQKAHAYVEHLNLTRFGGRKNWRLPTISELISLLRPPPRTDDLCVPPVFDPNQRWIWSADRHSFISAYYVDIDLGFVGWQDFSAPYYVRAVASL